MSVELTFEACVQDAQEYGSDDVWMVSRLFFWIRRKGADSGDFSADLSRAGGDKFTRVRISAPPDYTGPMAYADLRQRVGAEFEIGPIEVGPPVGAPMPLDASEFEERSVAYFRGLATESGMMIRVEGGRPLRGGTRPTAHIRLSNNVFVKRRSVTVETRSE